LVNEYLARHAEWYHGGADHPPNIEKLINGNGVNLKLACTTLSKIAGKWELPLDELTELGCTPPPPPKDRRPKSFRQSRGEDIPHANPDSIYVVFANVKTLGISFNLKGVNFSARSRIIKDSALSHKVGVFIVAEACTRAGFREDEDFLVYASGRRETPCRVKGLSVGLGMEIWIRKGIGITSRHVVVVMASPRIIHVSVQSPSLSVHIVGGHALCSASPKERLGLVSCGKSSTVARIPPPS
jgi:hypothetical protein